MKIEGHPYEFRIIASGVKCDETQDGLVHMSHGETYAIELASTAPCVAAIKIDGAEVGQFILRGSVPVAIERPADDNGLFTFFAAGTAEAIASMQSSVARKDRGLVEVVFTPERARPPVVASGLTRSLSVGASCEATKGGLSSGVTGLTGVSQQRFRTGHMDTDPNKAVTLRVRLVHDVARTIRGGVRPLRARVQTETPIPPMVD